MKCEECKNELIEFAKSGEVQWCECGIDEHGELKDFEDGERGFGVEIKLLFCKECETFHESYLGPAHDDTYEYTHIQEEIGLEEMLCRLSEMTQEDIEKIDFKQLKQICNTLKIKMPDVIKNIAYRIVENQRPKIYIPITIDDEDIPF